MHPDDATWSFRVFIPAGDPRAERAEPDEEPLPDDVARAAAVVLADIEEARPLGITLSYRTRELHDGGGVVVVSVGGERYGFGVDPAAPAEELMVCIADEIQEHLPETALAWAEARPACPGHRHPAAPRLDTGGAYWVCPSERRRLAPIGELHRLDGPS